MRGSHKLGLHDTRSHSEGHLAHIQTVIMTISTMTVRINRIDVLTL